MRVVYGFGIGTNPIGATASPTDGKLLMLHGKGNADIGPPPPLCLSPTAFKRNRVETMMETQFSNQLQRAGTRYSHPLLQRCSVTTSEEVMQVSPIPAYLVYDGFDCDVDAACLLERVHNNNFTSLDSGKHLQHLLRACLTAHNAGDNKPYVTDNSFSCTALGRARQWTRETFGKLFPALHQA